MITELLPWLKALTCPDSGPLLLVGGGYHQTIRLFEKNFGWMDIWGVQYRKPGITTAERLQVWGRGAMLFLNYTEAFALQPSKTTENQSRG